MSVRLSHRALCVDNIAHSTEFYSTAFGFRPTAAYDNMEGAWLDKCSGLPNVRLSAHRVVNSQGVELQLMNFSQPGMVGMREKRPMNTFGLTHLNFYVRDYEATLAAVRELGGKVHEHTRLDTNLEDGAPCSMIFCSDPDGARIEVWTSDPYGAGNSMAAPIPGVDRKFSHSGICTSNMERSLAFYAHLGLLKAETFDYRDYPGALDKPSEMEGVRLLAQMMRNEKGDVVELLFYAHPTASGVRERRPANRYGLSHLAFWVDDLDVTASQLRAAGGTVFPETRSGVTGFEQLQCADPDGVRIELMRTT